MTLRDTIVALATPHGRGGLGVVRLSGPQSRPIANSLLRFRFAEQVGSGWISWKNHWADLLDEDGYVVDQVVAAFFEAPRSYSGEDVIEISCHGSPVVLQLCVERALNAGARLAEPGEFTFRAYLNGRIDLPQAEAVRDLIDATTVYQARVAAQQLHGSVSKRIQPLKEQLLELISLMEAGIDFAEDDISVAPPHELQRRLRPLEQGLDALLQTFGTGRLVHSGFTLAIAGRPNVGKSSLFNRLLEQDRAIVTDIPGTTRDLVSESTTLAGIPVRLVDTAGIREGQDLVETLGIERSYSAMADADLTLLIFDGTTGWTEADEKLLESLVDRKPLLVRNKIDLAPTNIENKDHPESLSVSALTGQGIEALRDAILFQLAPNGLYAPESGSLTNLRHASLLRESREALENAGRAIDFGIPHEMILLDLYAALRPIDAVTGATTADDILNRIFSTFCIGK